MDTLEAHRKKNEQYLKENPLSEYPFGFTVKTKHFNNLEEGELPWVSKMFFRHLEMLYEDKYLSLKPLG